VPDLVAAQILGLSRQWIRPMVNEGSPPAAPPAGSPGHPAMVVIDRFTGDQGWLSNSAAGQVFIGGKVYPTREHAFQVAKTLDLDQRARIAGAATSADAHRLGQAVTLRPGWDDHLRYAVMWQVLASALDNNPGLGAHLEATGTALLAGGNTDHDRHWGAVCLCPDHREIIGGNHL